MKRVRDIINLQEQEPDGPANFNNANGDDTGPYANNQDGETTGGGRVQNYPVSASNVRWIRQQGGPFSFGFLRGHTLENLTLELLGTDLSASFIKDSGTEYDTLGARQQEEQNAALDYFNGEYQTIRAGIQSQYNAAYAASNFELALVLVNQLLSGSHVQEYDRLNAITNATTAERSALLNRMSAYIMGGKINNPDPYGLDHPELAALAAERERKRKKQEELEKNIEDSLKQLEIDNEKLKGEVAKRNILAIVDLGFDVATAIAVLSVFDGPAGELSLQAAKQAVRQFFTKGATKTAVKTAAKPFQNASDDLIRAITSPKTLSRATDATRNAPKGFKYDVVIDVKVGGTTQRVNAADILKYKGFQINSHQPKGNLLTESQKKVLRNIKKPYQVPELPKKYKMNFAGKYSAQNTPDQTASQISDTLVASGNARGQRWRQKDKDWVGYETSERMNLVYDKVGHGDQYWNMIVSDNLRKKKDRELQEQLNIIAHEKALVKENPNYETPFNKNQIDEQETLSADKDPLFKKVSKSLKKEIDYSDKPSKNGYPNDPPPKTINGYHPDLVNGQRASKYYNGLDPHSAESMPPTGNPEIDAKAKKAMDLKAKARKLKTLLGKRA